MAGEWFVYILQCVDGTFYTGITTDIHRRKLQHESGAGAKYTRGRGPFEVVYTELCFSRGEASRRELAIKGMGRQEKMGLVNKT